MKSLEDKKYLDKLKKWGLHSYPRNPDTRLYSNANWLKTVCAYLHTMPSHRVIVESNDELNFAVVSLKDRVLVFDQLWRYTDDETLEKINGSKIDFASSQDYAEACRVLIFDWRNIRRAIKGLAQQRNGVWWNKDRNFDGNSVLLELDLKGYPQYRFLKAGYIADFVLEEPVEAFYSFMRSDGAPFPIAVTKTKVYTFDPPRVWKRADIPEMDFREDFVSWWAEGDGREELSVELKPIYVHYHVEKQVQQIALQ